MHDEVTRCIVSDSNIKENFHGINDFCSHGVRNLEEHLEQSTNGLKVEHAMEMKSCEEIPPQS